MLSGGTGTAVNCWRDFSFLNQLPILRLVDESFQFLLLFDFLGELAAEVAASANGADNAGSLYASAEFPNNANAVFGASFDDLNVGGGMHINVREQ